MLNTAIKYKVYVGRTCCGLQVNKDKHKYEG